MTTTSHTERPGAVGGLTRLMGSLSFAAGALLGFALLTLLGDRVSDNAYWISAWLATATLGGLSMWLALRVSNDAARNNLARAAWVITLAQALLFAGLSTVIELPSLAILAFVVISTPILATSRPIMSAVGSSGHRQSSQVGRA